ncbi:hypothetical protein ACIPPM_06225 [Streptomyces sp. NPDC090119]
MPRRGAAEDHGISHAGDDRRHSASRDQAVDHGANPYSAAL